MEELWTRVRIFDCGCCYLGEHMCGIAAMKGASGVDRVCGTDVMMFLFLDVGLILKNARTELGRGYDNALRTHLRANLSPDSVIKLLKML